MKLIAKIQIMIYFKIEYKRYTNDIDSAIMAITRKINTGIHKGILINAEEYFRKDNSDEHQNDIKYMWGN